LKVEINLKIILFGILFFILEQIDVYFIFIISIILHEMAHLSVGMLIGLKPICTDKEKAGRKSSLI